MTYALQPVRAHNVTITLPGDMVFSFAETLNPNQSQYQPFADTLDTHVVYQELSGPKATLTPTDESGNPLSSDVWGNTVTVTPAAPGENAPIISAVTSSGVAIPAGGSFIPTLTVTISVASAGYTTERLIMLVTALIISPTVTLIMILSFGGVFIGAVDPYFGFLNHDNEDHAYLSTCIQK